jgi:hypothetical protein
MKSRAAEAEHAEEDGSRRLQECRFGIAELSNNNFGFRVLLSCQTVRRTES